MIRGPGSGAWEESQIENPEMGNCQTGPAKGLGPPWGHVGATWSFENVSKGERKKPKLRTENCQPVNLPGFRATLGPRWGHLNGWGKVIRCLCCFANDSCNNREVLVVTVSYLIID